MPQVSDVPLDGLYGDRILDHYRNPRNRQAVDNPQLEASEFNPFCGDRVDLHLKLGNDGRINQTNAGAEGCSIIQASASMLSDVINGKSLEEVEQLAADFRSMMLGKDISQEALARLETLDALQVVRRYPVRIKCALLPWVALEQGLEAYRKRRA
ncbi:MAG: SUF system NifU family Fe-S cluster assembly protein [SAR202 cluster bacterium Io17-Chloro-G9]|nr:MAG: SUF system NifU family Fe-S cluster assembly protein [SAR202 cluster bacterium Io17-Chloro-G9]